MGELLQLHGINWMLTGNSDWDDPDVQVKMASARSHMDITISARSHGDYDMEPAYGRHQGESPYDVGFGYDDLKIMAGGDLDGLGFRWEYVLGIKFILVDHWIVGKPHVGEIKSFVPSWQLIPAIIAFRDTGEVDIYSRKIFEEIGFITTGIDTVEGPYQLEAVQITNDPHLSAPLLPNGFGQWTRPHSPSLPAGLEQVPKDADDNPVFDPPLTFVMQGKMVPGRSDLPEPELVQSWYEIPPSHTELTSDLVNWEELSPIYEEIIPIGTNQFEWGQWAGDTRIHNFQPGYCHEEGGEERARKLYLRDATWYGGWKYLSTICYKADVRPDWGEEYSFGHVPILNVAALAGTYGVPVWEDNGGVFYGTHVEDVDYTWSLWPYCEGEWPFSPLVHGQEEYKLWGYLAYKYWGPQSVLWILPPVPEEEPWPESFPGKYYWDLIPPPGGEMATARGIWYELDIGGQLGAPYIWAVRMAVEVEGHGGHYYDLHFPDYYYIQSTVVRDDNGNPDGHGFYFTLGHKLRESRYDRIFLDDVGDYWPFSYTDIWHKCTCYHYFAQCGDYYSGYECDHSEQEWWEVYEGEGGYWDVRSLYTFLIQFDDELYEIEDARNTDYSGSNGSYSDCHPRYYIWPELSTAPFGDPPNNRIFLGGWGIGEKWYYSFIMDKEHEYVSFPRIEPAYGYKGTMSEFPDMIFDDEPVWHNGMTRLMYRYQIVRETLGPLHEVWAAWGRDKTFGLTEPDLF